MNVTEAAQGRWPSILVACGVDAEFLRNRHGPCPACGGKDRYRFDDKDGRGGFYCNQCGAGDGFDLLQKVNGWTFREAADEVRRVIPEAVEFKRPEPKDPLPRLRKISRGLMHVGDEVGAYLTNRGLEPKRWRNVREHPGLSYYRDGQEIGRYPAMVGIVTDANNEPVTLHVTYLKDGRKAPVDPCRKVMPGVKKLNGCSVKLGEGEEIAVTEGIETAMAVEAMTGLPTWAAISEQGVRRLDVPKSVRAVHVYGDHDANFVGQSAAFDLAKRLQHDGIHAEVHIPNEPGDWLDFRVNEAAR